MDTPPARPAPRLPAALVGLAVTVAQVACVLALSPESSLGAAYDGLVRWDGGHYARIASEGYRTADAAGPGSIAAWFPAYPLLARALSAVSGLSTVSALPLVAQLAAWWTWTHVLLFLRRWRTPRALAVATTLAIACHPTAFFLVTGLSESLFMAAFLGFLFWSEVPGRRAWAAAALHGLTMTATRVVGLPLAALPLLGAWLAGRAKPRSAALRRGLALTAAASAGGVAFLVHSHFAFGRWDEYFQMQRASWGLVPDYLALLRPSTYALPGPIWHTYTLNVLLVPATLAAFAALLLAERFLARRVGAPPRRVRILLYAAAGTMFYVYVSGLANAQMRSMVRYVFTVHAPLALAAGHLFSGAAVGGWRRAWVGALVAASVPALLLQAYYARLYAGGGWVG